VQIPTNDEYSSLNVAAAVMVLCYEIRKAALQEQGTRNKEQGENAGSSAVSGITDALAEVWDQPLATVAEMEGFLAHLEQVLAQLEVLDPKAPRQLMTRLRRLYTRIRPDRMEINLLRGMLTATQTKLGKNGGGPPGKD
jgi:tRNA C32,U32 (ribose-2'-O)-methylase TrmJ